MPPVSLGATSGAEAIQTQSKEKRKAMIELTCTSCWWSGYPEELIALTDDLDDKDFSYCPRCNGNNFDKDEEEDNT